MSHSTWGRVVVPIVLERTMQVDDPEEEIEKVAQAGSRGMVGARREAREWCCAR